MAKRKAPGSVRGRVHTRYYTGTGEPVVGVTTLIKKQKEAPALIHWAWKLGLEGIDYKTVRDVAGNIGTLGHEMVRLHFMGFTEKDPEWGKLIEVYPSKDISMAENCYLGTLEWLDRNHFIPILVEQKMVSKKLKVGGTLDTFGLLNAKRTLVDIKTGKGIYPDHWEQVAGYEELLEEIWKYKYEFYAPKKDKWSTADIQAAIRKVLWANGHKINTGTKLIEDRIILHLNKEDGRFTPIPAPDLTDHRKLFLMQAKSYPVWKRVYQPDGYWSKRRNDK